MYIGLGRTITRSIIKTFQDIEIAYEIATETSLFTHGTLIWTTAFINAAP